MSEQNNVNTHEEALLNAVYGQVTITCEFCSNDLAISGDDAEELVQRAYMKGGRYQSSQFLDNERAERVLCELCTDDKR